MTHSTQDYLGHNRWMPATANCYKTLDQTTLDLWLISLERPVEVDVLSADEINRLNRYRFATDQRKFAVARTSLRQILAHYSQIAPAKLSFDYGAHGKPFLSNECSLQFNLSHSGEYALCGVARQAVGVDIEQLRVMDRLEGLVKRCLTVSEQRALAKVLPEQQSTGFLRYWTCKEAYLKATGQGISESLTAIEVDLGPTPQLKAPGQLWQLQIITPCIGYTAAVVMPPDIIQLRYWKYDGPS